MNFFLNVSSLLILIGLLDKGLVWLLIWLSQHSQLITLIHIGFVIVLQLSMNEAAKGLRPSSKATEFVKALGKSGVEHVCFNTDDIVTTVSETLFKFRIESFNKIE